MDRQIVHLKSSLRHSEVSQFSPKLIVKIERQVWRKSWDGSAASGATRVLVVNDSRGLEADRQTSRQESSKSSDLVL